MNCFRIIFFSLFCVAFGRIPAHAQGLKIQPLQHRYTEVVPHSNHAMAAVITDTLALPFFEDFISATGYPSSKRWTDNLVWVNNSFPVSPPNYNVATFDHLNQNGKPYTAFNKNAFTYADSLTSQPINLATYKQGPNTLNYAISDSIYLSFFFEKQGLGDSPESEDSLLLFFKTSAGKWKKMWGVNGATGSGFQQVSVALVSSDWLYPDFQFRFVNYTKATGNLNHWHVDYIQLDKNRSRNNLAISDVAITKATKSYLKNYTSMPYSHFKTDVSGQSRGDHFVLITNLDNINSVQTRFAYTAKNQWGTVLGSQALSASLRNIPPGESTENFTKFIIDTLASKFPCITTEYLIAPQSGDGTPTAYNAQGDNNRYTQKQCFTPWYAYDDGSAEGGIALDYAFLGNIKGQFAMKFTNLKADSLRGLAIYFDRNSEDVSFRSFYLRVWKALSPIGSPDNKDQLWYEYYVDRPTYTDSINHFTYIYFDTVLPLSTGDYYVGWRQNQPFLLNVGYDNNYRYQETEVRNPNLFQNLLGQWENVNFNIQGTPMIRPLLGEESDYSFKTNKPGASILSVYPNPTDHWIHWNSDNPVAYARLYNLSGSLVLSQIKPADNIDISSLQSGVYILHLQLENGTFSTRKVIKK